MHSVYCTVQNYVMGRNCGIPSGHFRRGYILHYTFRILHFYSPVVTSKTVLAMVENTL